MSRPDPTIPYDHFRHAQIEAVDWPHSHRLILTLTPLTWTGLQGTHSAPIQLHFYDVQLPGAVASFFAALVGEEVAFVRLDPNKHSTYHMVYTLIVLERLQQEITVQSRDLVVLPKQRPVPTVADGMTVVDWLAQELQSVLSSERRARYRKFSSLCQQLMDYAIHLSVHDKRMITNRVLYWRDTMMIDHYTIPSDEHTLHFLGDMIGTIDGILAE